ncbi:competence type IV pilus minor pilin ComGF [Halalkalibacterium halodurans]|uniref:competence type IV pilus minor pilin ComGF n=1 Tax=Halalkalibacterium halodurans TaxID=86665 RepID=UPI00059FF3EE
MQNCKGFTLIEVLLTLALIMILLTVIPLFLPLLSLPSSSTISTNETIVFFNQLAAEARQSVRIEFDSPSRRLLLYQPSGDIISFELITDERIRRQVNRQGQIIVLYHVVDFYCESTAEIWRCAIYDQTGRVGERPLPTFEQLAGVKK